jgi:hypothetical protein
MPVRFTFGRGRLGSSDRRANVATLLVARGSTPGRSTMRAAMGGRGGSAGNWHRRGFCSAPPALSRFSFRFGAAGSADGPQRRPTRGCRSSSARVLGFATAFRCWSACCSACAGPGGQPLEPPALKGSVEPPAMAVGAGAGAIVLSAPVADAGSGAGLSSHPGTSECGLGLRKEGCCCSTRPTLNQ